MTGDVTNAGITDASGLVLYVGAPATPIQPYANYAVGALASDDFSSFTLSFTTNDLSAIPVTIQWKDANGNTLTTTQTLDLRSLYAPELALVHGRMAFLPREVSADPVALPVVLGPPSMAVVHGAVSAVYLAVDAAVASAHSTPSSQAVSSSSSPLSSG